jgi:hypothetical protein
VAAFFNYFFSLNQKSDNPGLCPAALQTSPSILIHEGLEKATPKFPLNLVFRHLRWRF